MKLSFINLISVLALILILVGYLFPMVHPSFLGSEGNYILSVYTYFLTHRSLSYPDFFVFFPLATIFSVLIVLLKKNISYQWLFPIGTTLAILASGFAYLYVLQSGYDLFRLGVGWLCFYVAGNLIAFIGLFYLLKDFKLPVEKNNFSTNFNWSIKFNGKIAIKIIFSIFKLMIYIALIVFIYKSCSTKDSDKEIQVEQKFNTTGLSSIPMKDINENNRYFLISHQKDNQLHTITYVRIGNDADAFGKMEINCTKNLIRKISVENQNSLLSSNLDLGPWYTPTPDWTDKDIFNFICNR